jgi:hypothetical protein
MISYGSGIATTESQPYSGAQRVLHEEDDRLASTAEERRIAAGAEKLEAAIAERGVGRVLAEMIANPSLFALRYRWNH